MEEGKAITDWISHLQPMGTAFTSDQISSMDVEDRNMHLYRRIHKFEPEKSNDVMRALVQLEYEEVVALLQSEEAVKAKIKEVLLAQRLRGVFKAASVDGLTVERIFQQMDTDRSGDISQSEFKEKLQSMAHFKDLHESEVANLMLALDRGKTGKITMLEFVRFLEDSVLIMSDKLKIGQYRQAVSVQQEKKSGLDSYDDLQRRALQAQMAQKFNELEVATSKHKAGLLAVLESLQQVMSAHAVTQADLPSPQYIGYHSGRDAAMAQAWLENYTNSPTEAVTAPGAITVAIKQELAKHCQNVINEIAYLDKITLAAKIVAMVVSPMHKKLLNLCHTWISTLLPYCLAKVNRVSFGLLTEDDCKAALAQDQHVPRSRLKLAVPFIGKDVPSKASEFAHPDIIIGLTVLAFR